MCVERCDFYLSGAAELQVGHVPDCDTDIDVGTQVAAGFVCDRNELIEKLM